MTTTTTRFGRLVQAAALAAGLWLGAGAAAQAGSLDVGPVTFQLYGAERTSTLSVRNTTAEPVSVQVRTFDWTQNGDDILAPSQALQVSPAFFEIGAGEEQVVRLVIAQDLDTSREAAFRLFVDEIRADDSSSSGVVMPLRLIIPVFLTPGPGDRPELSWSASSEGDTVTVTATNSGTARERIVGLAIDDQNDGDIVAVEGLAGYVLAGATRSWTLPAPGAASLAALKVGGEGYGGPIAIEVPLDR